MLWLAEPDLSMSSRCNASYVKITKQQYVTLLLLQCRISNEPDISEYIEDILNNETFMCVSFQAAPVMKAARSNMLGAGMANNKVKYSRLAADDDGYIDLQVRCLFFSLSNSANPN